MYNKRHELFANALWVYDYDTDNGSDNYSLFKFITGFVHAAFIACQLTVIRHINKLINIIKANTQMLNVV